MFSQAVRRLCDALAAFDVIEVLDLQMEDAAEAVAGCVAAGGRIWLCGNGGSMSQASHWAGELVGRLKRNRPPIPAVALGQDAGVTTCLVNDFDPANLFSRQLEAVAKPGDVLIAISTSGTSENVLRAIDAAYRIGLLVVGFGGPKGIRRKCDHEFIALANDTATIQEIHGVMGHELCRAVEARLFPGGDQ